MKNAEETLAEARLLARSPAYDGQDELHVTSGNDHASHVNCWCEPELHYVDPVTDVRVYAHRRRH